MGGQLWLGSAEEKEPEHDNNSSTGNALSAATGMLTVAVVIAQWLARVPADQADTEPTTGSEGQR